ncbi:MAG: type II toxin-antitoxin system RelE/ParE family toxin [Steroidobacteraceae bacterium]
MHAFQKKTQQTAKADIELAKVRYRIIGVKP